MHVRLVALKKEGVLCPECEALWMSTESLCASKFVDYGTFMRAAGRKHPDAKGELEFLGPVLQ